MKHRKLTVATFSDFDKAEVVKDRIEKAGIPAEIYDESELQRLWFLSRPLANEKVKVDEKDFDRARHVLEAADTSEQLLHCEIKCPQCGSPLVEYPQFTRKFVTTTLVEVFCLLHIIDRQFYCKRCHYSWPASDHLRPKMDLLNWPDKGHPGLTKREE
jgi:hypothetical protein